MKKGEIYQGIVEYTAFPNKGYVRVCPDEDQTGNDTAEGAQDDQAGLVMIKNVLPGQMVSFRLTKKKHGKFEGKLLQLLSPGAEELAEPACSHDGVCGGCLYQRLSYEKQLELKENQVLSLLRPVLPDVDILFEGIRKSPRVCGYRNKMEYTFGDEYQDGPLSLGLHKRGAFYDIVPVTGCRIADADFGRILDASRSFFAEKKIPHYHRMRHTGYLRHLLVRKAAYTGEILVDLITTGQLQDEQDGPMLQEWCQRLLALPLEGTFAGILHTVNNSLADVVRDEGTELLYGKASFEENCLGLSFTITPFSFFQTNSTGAEVLYAAAREFLQEALPEREEPDLRNSGKQPQPTAEKAGSENPVRQRQVVYDLYSGTGTIAQLLAPAADKVIGVEIVPEAVEAARINAEKNGLHNCAFLAGDVLKVLDEIEEKPDLIVLDPPRDGVHPKALSHIISYGVEFILYISCKPTSLARDLVALQAGGYRVKRLCCVDMFPATANIETVCLLSKLSEAKYHVNITLDMDEMDLTAADK